jgi:excisionase family DNA binding protein
MNGILKKIGGINMNSVIVVSPNDLKEFIEVAVKNVLSEQPLKENSKKKNEVLVLSEAAEYCRMPVPTFREYLGRREIRGAKIGKSWRFFTEDLDEFMHKYKVKTHSEIDKEIDDELSK